MLGAYVYAVIEVMTMAAAEMMLSVIGPSNHAWSTHAVRTIAAESARFFEIESMYLMIRPTAQRRGGRRANGERTASERSKRGTRVRGEREASERQVHGTRKASAAGVTAALAVVLVAA